MVVVAVVVVAVVVVDFFKACMRFFLARFLIDRCQIFVQKCSILCLEVC